MLEKIVILSHNMKWQNNYEGYYLSIIVPAVVLINSARKNLSKQMPQALQYLWGSKNILL